MSPSELAYAAVYIFELIPLFLDEGWGLSDEIVIKNACVRGLWVSTTIFIFFLSGLNKLRNIAVSPELTSHNSKTNAAGYT